MTIKITVKVPTPTPEQIRAWLASKGFAVEMEFDGFERWRSVDDSTDVPIGRAWVDYDQAIERWIERMGRVSCRATSEIYQAITKSPVGCAETVFVVVYDLPSEPTVDVFASREAAVRDARCYDDAWVEERKVRR